LLTGDALTPAAVAAVVERLGARGRADLGAPDAELRATYDLRYAGQAFELPVESGLAPEPADLRAAFDRAHADRYGYSDPGAELELVTVRVAAALPGTEARMAGVGDAEHRGTRRARFGDKWHEAAVHGPGSGEIVGPAIVELPDSTLVVPPGWSGTADASGVVLEAT